VVEAVEAAAARALPAVAAAAPTARAQAPSCGNQPLRRRERRSVQLWIQVGERESFVCSSVLAAYKVGYMVSNMS